MWKVAAKAEHIRLYFAVHSVATRTNLTEALGPLLQVIHKPWQNTT